MAKTIKTAISLPRKTFEKAEISRKKQGLSRSTLYTNALETYFGIQKVKELESRYVAGYQTHPEEITDIRAALKASSSIFSQEDW
ncbi:MAG: hypothetical protein HY399_01870 [Elusimicrobia bacterium]|nr:hypothetical protein [Elusimicrobiota bacterium]